MTISELCEVITNTVIINVYLDGALIASFSRETYESLSDTTLGYVVEEITIQASSNSVKSVDVTVTE